MNLQTLYNRLNEQFFKGKLPGATVLTSAEFKGRFPDYRLPENAYAFYTQIPIVDPNKDNDYIVFIEDFTDNEYAQAAVMLHEMTHQYNWRLLGIDDMEHTNTHEHFPTFFSAAQAHGLIQSETGEDIYGVWALDLDMIEAFERAGLDMTTAKAYLQDARADVIIEKDKNGLAWIRPMPPEADNPT